MAQSYIDNARAVREAMDFAGATLSEENALVCVHLYRPSCFLACSCTYKSVNNSRISVMVSKAAEIF